MSPQPSHRRDAVTSVRARRPPPPGVIGRSELTLLATSDIRLPNEAARRRLCATGHTSVAHRRCNSYSRNVRLTLPDGGRPHRLIPNDGRSTVDRSIVGARFGSGSANVDFSGMSPGTNSENVPTAVWSWWPWSVGDTYDNVAHVVSVGPWCAIGLVASVATLIVVTRAGQRTVTSGSTALR